jgi:intraflagellar transport protein 88
VDLRERQKKAESYIALAAKLIAPGVDKDLETGFNNIIDQLKATDYPHLASELEMTRAVAYLKNKEFEKALDLFKSLEKKDHMLASPASNNLSFLYYLQGDITNANKYADAAIKAEKYNAKALVNRGNCYYAKQKWQKACDYYMEAISAEVS